MKEIGYALLAVLLMAGCGLDSREEKAPAAEDIPAAQEIKVHEIPEAAEALYHKAAVKTFSDGIRIEVIDSDIKVTTIQPGIVETPFSEVRFHGDKERAAAVYEGIDALQAEDIADIIIFAVNRPKRVQISDIVIMANQQGTGFLVSKKK